MISTCIIPSLPRATARPRSSVAPVRPDATLHLTGNRTPLLRQPLVPAKPSGDRNLCGIAPLQPSIHAPNSSRRTALTSPAVQQPRSQSTKPPLITCGKTATTTTTSTSIQIHVRSPPFGRLSSSSLHPSFVQPPPFRFPCAVNSPTIAPTTPSYLVEIPPFIRGQRP
ncbi:hypothetical protein RYX36_005176 [Vicia faba]